MFEPIPIPINLSKISIATRDKSSESEIYLNCRIAVANLQITSQYIEIVVRECSLNSGYIGTLTFQSNIITNIFVSILRHRERILFCWGQTHN